MADFLCPVYSILLTPTHVPERPEGSFCTVVNPSELERNKDNDSEGICGPNFNYSISFKRSKLILDQKEMINQI